MQNVLANLRPHRLHTARDILSALVLAPSAKVPHSPSQAETLAEFAPELQHLKTFRFPSAEPPILFAAA